MNYERTSAPCVWLGVLTLALIGVAGCGDDDRPATWSYIHEAVIAPNCTASACHSKISAVSGLRLDTLEVGYQGLAGCTCEDDLCELVGAPDHNLVVSGDPARSRLMHLLIGTNTQRPMPPDVPLPPRDIDLVEQWILEGARCN